MFFTREWLATFSPLDVCFFCHSEMSHQFPTVSLCFTKLIGAKNSSRFVGCKISPLQTSTYIIHHKRIFYLSLLKLNHLFSMACLLLAHISCADNVICVWWFNYIIIIIIIFCKTFCYIPGAYLSHFISCAHRHRRNFANVFRPECCNVKDSWHTAHRRYGEREKHNKYQNKQTNSSQRKYNSTLNEKIIISHNRHRDFVVICILNISSEMQISLHEPGEGFTSGIVKRRLNASRLQIFLTIFHSVE